VAGGETGVPTKSWGKLVCVTVKKKRFSLPKGGMTGTPLGWRGWGRNETKSPVRKSSQEVGVHEGESEKEVSLRGAAFAGGNIQKEAKGGGGDG